MRRSFWNGLITGGMVGAIVGLVFAPVIREQSQRQIAAGARKLSNRARRVIRRVTGRAEDLVED